MSNTSDFSAFVNLTHGAWVTQAIYVAAHLGIADHLSKGPRSASQLASLVGADSTALYRLLRALASIGVFEEQSEQTFSLTPMAEFLREDHPTSCRNLALMRGQPENYITWGSLLSSIETGSPVFEQIFGQTRFDRLMSQPADNKFFNDYMDDKNSRMGPVMVASYDFSPFEHVVDVGGGHGGMLGAILQKHRHLRGTLFDLPSVVNKASGTLDTFDINERVKIIAGDFFEKIPAGDGFILFNVLHNWDDAHAVRILANVVRAMPPNGRILVLEMIVSPESATPSSAPWFDLHMLVTLGGKERTEKEFRALLADTGLHLNRIVSTPTPINIMECIPATSSDGNS